MHIIRQIKGAAIDMTTAASSVGVSKPLCMYFSVDVDHSLPALVQPMHNGALKTVNCTLEGSTIRRQTESCSLCQIDEHIKKHSVSFQRNSITINHTIRPGNQNSS